MDIAVTVPKREMRRIASENAWAEEAVREGSTVVQYWSVAKLPKKLNSGDRIYFIEDGRITHYHEYVDYALDAECEVTGKVWEGMNLVMKYPGVRLTVPRRMQGFRGFRYVERVE